MRVISDTIFYAYKSNIKLIKINLCEISGDR